MVRYRARRKARAKAGRERLEALGERLRAMARAPGDPDDARRQALTEALEAWQDTLGGLVEARR